MFDVNNLYQLVEQNLLLLKWTGVILVFVASLYFIFSQKIKNSPTISWKRVIAMAFVAGVMNAGIVVFFGKFSFFITPLTLGLLLALWLTNKLPQAWKGKHVIVFGSFFTISSVAVFLSVTLVFFHLAVEGKL